MALICPGWVSIQGGGRGRRYRQRCPYLAQAALGRAADRARGPEGLRFPPCWSQWGRWISSPT